MACNCADLQKIDRPGDERGEAAANTEAASAYPPVDSCGRCNSCRKIENGSHPDVLLVRPAGAFIQIDQIRELNRIIAMKPYEAKTRAVIISDAQTMNLSAGNALLKLLEEPPAGTILILIATQGKDLMPTIVSRCQLIRFNPLSRRSLTGLLAGDAGMSIEEASVVAALAGGSLSQAQNMFRNHWVVRRNWLIREISQLSERPSTYLLALAEALAHNKEGLQDTLDILSIWLRDLIVGRLDPEKIINRDLAADIRDACRREDVDTWLHRLETVTRTRQRLQNNTNPRLALENMFLELAA